MQDKLQEKTRDREESSSLGIFKRVDKEIRKERQMKITCMSPGRIWKLIGLED